MGVIIRVAPNGSDSATVGFVQGGGAVLGPHLDVQIDRSLPMYFPTQARHARLCWPIEIRDLT
jgi:hypothetical protein